MSKIALTRRAALAATAGIAAGSVTPVAAQAKRKTFVLVHGAYHGGWCWKFDGDLGEQRP